MTDTADLPPGTVPGLVLRIDAKVCHVEVEGQEMQLPLRGRLFEQRTHEKRPLAVGDRVAVQLTQEGGAIHSRMPRDTRLARKAAAGDEREQVLAANVSLVLLVMAVREPQFQPDLVDRILAEASREGIPAVLAITKLDRDKKKLAPGFAELYRSIGYEVLCTSVAEGKETGPELERLHDLLAENVTVLTGPSGAGKSTLLNHLSPGFHLKVGSLSKIRQGRHTTTHTRLLKLPFGRPGTGYVLDTPGIRSFGLYGVGAQELSFWFKEFQPFLQACPFRDCSHTVEPDCAVQQAVVDGAIAVTRFNSYLAMLEDARRQDKADADGD